MQQSKLRRLQRKLSRQQKGSQNRNKTKRRLAKMHYRVGNVRKDTLHKLTTELTNNYGHIIIEDLVVSSMVKNRRMAQSILDIGWYEFRRQLSYKSQQKGSKIWIADKWYASSKKCSECGHKKTELLLSERVYCCEECKVEIDRDLNAARCLEQLLNTGSSPEIDACGQNGSVIMLKTQLQPVWQNQELSTV